MRRQLIAFSSQVYRALALRRRRQARVMRMTPVLGLDPAGRARTTEVVAAPRRMASWPTTKNARDAGRDRARSQRRLTSPRYAPPTRPSGAQAKVSSAVGDLFSCCAGVAGASCALCPALTRGAGPSPPSGLRSVARQAPPVPAVTGGPFACADGCWQVECWQFPPTSSFHDQTVTRPRRGASRPARDAHAQGQVQPATGGHHG